MASTPPKKQHRTSQSKPVLYTLRVELVGSEPLIWREILIDGRTRLGMLHHILQAAMGWSDAHLHRFDIRDKHYGVPAPEYDDEDWEMLDDKKFRLNQLLDVGDTCIYLYDFGDNWEHRIRVQKIEEPIHLELNDGLVSVIAGEGACPPDDVGGISGYQEYLQRCDEEPYSDETAYLREWAGLDFNPDHFDRHAANAAIDRMLWNGWIKIGA